jgi:hypothetical protein
MNEWKWTNIIRNNFYDYYFDYVGNKKILFVAVHSIGLNFPIALVANGKLLTQEEIMPSEKVFKVIETAALCDISAISIFSNGKFVDAYYTTSTNRLNQLLRQIA